MCDVLAEKPPSVTAVFPGSWTSSTPLAQPREAELLCEVVTWGWDRIPSADLEKEKKTTGEGMSRDYI